MPVWALARVRGSAPEREWLLYLHSPEEDRPNVEIELPDFGDICMPATREGAHYLVSEEPKSVRALMGDGSLDDAVPACRTESEDS